MNNDERLFLTDTLIFMDKMKVLVHKSISEFMLRIRKHDYSKLSDQEFEQFSKITKHLKGVTYGSDKYKAFLKELPLDHHYSNNRHHPEHFVDGIDGMNLIDVIEMICDWKASTLRHGDGDIYKSIEINQKRFSYPDDIKQLFINTAKWLDSKEIINMNPKEHPAGFKQVT